MQSHYNEAPDISLSYLIYIKKKKIKCKHAAVQDGRYKNLRALFSKKRKKEKKETYG